MKDVEQAYQQSNCLQAAFLIVQKNAAKGLFQYGKQIDDAAKQRHHNEMPLNIAPNKRKMNNPRPEIRTLDDSANWCAMPTGDLQNHIAWCFERFADFTDYVHYEEYFSCLNNAKYIRFNAVAILVTSF